MELGALERTKKQFAVKVVGIGSLLQIIKLDMSEKKMRKRYLATAVFLGASLIASAALAQPSTNGPSGTGPEGSSGTSITGSGQNEPGTTTGRQGASTKMTKHHASKKSQNNRM